MKTPSHELEIEPGSIWIRNDSKSRVRVTGYDGRAVDFVYAGSVGAPKPLWALPDVFLKNFTPYRWDEDIELARLCDAMVELSRVHPASPKLKHFFNSALVVFLNRRDTNGRTQIESGGTVGVIHALSEGEGAEGQNGDNDVTKVEIPSGHARDIPDDTGGSGGGTGT